MEFIFTTRKLFNRLILRGQFGIIYYFLTRIKIQEAAAWLLSTGAFLFGAYVHFFVDHHTGLAILAWVLVFEILFRAYEFLKIGKPRYHHLKLEKRKELPSSVTDLDKDMPIAELTAHPRGSERDFKPDGPKSGVVILRSHKLDEKLILSQTGDNLLRYEVLAGYERNLLKEFKMFEEDMEDFLPVLRSGATKRALFLEANLSIASAFNESIFDQGEAVQIGRTLYHTSLLTNEACSRVLLRDERIVCDFRLMYPYMANDVAGSPGHLQALELSALANHVGVSTLALTSDGYLVVHRQNELTQVSQNLVAPSGSGSLDWVDHHLAKTDDFLAVVRYGMARELREECGLDNNSRRGGRDWSVKSLAQNTLILGYSRWLERGGKPEFMGITRLNCKINEIAPDAKESDRGIRNGTNAVSPSAICTALDLEVECDKLLARHDLSIPLWTVLSQIKKILDGGFDSEIRTALLKHWGLIEK